MKYEKYKQLSPEDKEEWNYRFKNLEIPYSNALNYAIIFYFCYIIGIFVTFLMIKDLVGYSEEAVNFYLYTNKVGAFFITLFIFEYMIKVGFWVHKTYLKQKWLRQRFKK